MDEALERARSARGAPSGAALMIAHFVPISQAAPAATVGTGVPAVAPA